MPENTDDVAVLSPVIPELKTDEDIQDLTASFGMFATLSAKKLLVMTALAHDLVSEKSRSNAQLARDLGIKPHTIGIYRSDPDFGTCLGLLVVGIARGRSDLYLRWTEEAAQAGKVQALKLLWEISGIYIQRSKNVNVNVDYGFRVSEPTQDYVEAVDEFLIALGEAGWSSQQVAARMNELRATGAW